MSFLLGLPIFEGYVKFQGCTWTSPEIDDSGQDLSFREDFFAFQQQHFSEQLREGLVAGQSFAISKSTKARLLW